MVMGPTHRWNDTPPVGHPELKGKMHKKPTIAWKTLEATNADAILRFRKAGNVNIFARTGKVSGVFVVDVDVKDSGLEAYGRRCNKKTAEWSAIT